MISEHGKVNRIILVSIITALLITLPVSATVPIAIYGDTAGFNPDLHRDEFSVAYSLDGNSGPDLDREIGRYTDPSVGIIFMGGDDSFSVDTASQIEEAVASGKILVVTNKHFRRFNASLPATNTGLAPDGKYMKVPDADTPLIRKIFEGLRTHFPNTDPLSDRLNTTAKGGSTILLEYENNDPALLYGKYGSGYIIEWAMISNRPYLNTTEADFINVRLIRSLLASPIPRSATTTVPVTASITPSPVPPQPSPAVPDTGSILVYSSPKGASILIDGIYYGTTPGNLTSIPQGNHIIRLALSGYFDYEGTIYVIPGQMSHAFGTLQPVNQISAAPTAIPIIVPVLTPEPVQTASKGLLETSSVVVAIIGVITASIAAGATIFSHIAKVKKEGKE